MLTSDVDKNAYVDKFHAIPNDLFPKEEADKIVDVALGKNFIVICTESGKMLWVWLQILQTPQRMP